MLECRVSQALRDSLLPEFAQFLDRRKRSLDTIINHYQPVDLSGSTKPAPFLLRPFSGLFNPYPYGCSVLCNHPADGEAKDVVRRAKDCWATEGKALLLPAEMELIRATLLAGGRPVRVRPRNSVGGNVPDATTVPEELFRRYTETDSRPLTPAPTLASGPALYVTSPDPPAVHLRERTTLVLDLRANSQDQDIETLSWHALSLEPLPSPRRNSGILVPRPPALLLPLNPTPSAVPAAPPPTVNVSNASTPKNVSAVDLDSESDEPPMRRRGKRLRKRKCRRGSTYGQQTEVRDPPEPLETQVSQVETGDRENSDRPSVVDGTVVSASDKEPIDSKPNRIIPKSFIDADILKHLGRQLDRDTVEGEFSVKRRIALEEALRVKGEFSSRTETAQENEPSTSSLNVPRVFSRQSSRFEIPLDSRTLAEMSSLDYLSRHVFVTPGRKLIFRRAFNRYFEEDDSGVRRMPPNNIPVALEEVMGRSLADEQSTKFKSTVGEVEVPVDFRTWCGICAAAERLLAPLPPREADPPTWIERVDLEGLERRLRSVEADPKLAFLLTEIRDR